MDEENSNQAGLQRTPRSSGDDEETVLMEEDAPGPSDFSGLRFQKSDDTDL